MSPAVFTEEELHEIVRVVQESGAFAFDVETRGNVERHGDVLALIEYEWQEKLATLKTTHEGTLARSRQTIVDRWTSELALDTQRNEVFWLGIATEGRSWAIPMGHPNGEVLVNERRGDGSTVPPVGYRAVLKSGKESTAKAKYFIPAVFTDAPTQLTKEQVFTILEPIFMDEHILKVNQNVKFDAKSIAKYFGGKLPEGQYIDPQVLAAIANENLGGYSLVEIIAAFFQDHDPYWRDGKIGATVVFEPFSKVVNYVHFDVRWAWLAYKKLHRMIAKVPGLFQALLRDLPVISIVAQMEANGIAVNKREMKKLGTELDIHMNDIIRDMSDYVPVGFNPNSAPAKVALLFGSKKEGGLGLKRKKGKGDSVDAEVLKSLQGSHPLIDLLLDYAEVKKMKSTYVEGMIPMLHSIPGSPNLGKLHPQFHLHRARTGRFSSSDPNLQNIPRDGRMRALFVAEPGESLVVADYSQIEMRLMAMFSQDPAMLHIFENDIDAHFGTASVVLGRPPETSEERTTYGKVPNFLLGYGGGPKRLVASTNGKIGLKQAESIVAGYDKGYAGWTEWKAKCVQKGRRLGYVETLGGRRRRLPDLNADVNAKDGWWKRTSAERQAVNAVIQGTAAEIIKDAMVALDGVLPFPTCKMLLQVHDEMVISIPTGESGLWVPKIEEAMGNLTYISTGVQGDKPVKLTVEAHTAASWSEAKG